MESSLINELDRTSNTSDQNGGGVGMMMMISGTTNSSLTSSSSSTSSVSMAAGTAVGAMNASSPASSSRYENQKRRDWNTFGQYLKNHRPPLSLSRCSGAHVLEFLRYLDQFGKTKVHAPICPFYGHPNPPALCPCPLRQAWGSLDALIGRLRAAFEENGGKPEANPFGARAVRLYLREVRDLQSKARGISYDKKKRKRPPPPTPPPPPPPPAFPPPPQQLLQPSPSAAAAEALSPSHQIMIHHQHLMLPSASLHHHHHHHLHNHHLHRHHQ